MIHKEDVFQLLNIGMPFITAYFNDGIVIYIYKLDPIEFDAFFQFVCLFTFFTTEDIVSILVLLSGIYSNIIVSSVYK